ncbi:MAG: leucyl/phenylalanyl-tRNA--protein transferase [Pyrinomonadaceae bacterium]
MMLSFFPNPRAMPDDEDVIAAGDIYAPEVIVDAYRHGIFPWPHQGYPLLWFCLAERAILEFKHLHIPRSLQREQHRAKFEFTIDKAFDQVITACANVPRTDGGGTWITHAMIRAYTELHRRGVAHSVEAWDGENLVGGLYGVDAGGAFAGESMFYLQPNASKLALLHLIEHLKTRGAEWMDIQQLTPHMERLGAHLVSRNDFLDKLERAQVRKLKLFTALPEKSDLPEKS